MTKNQSLLCLWNNPKRTETRVGCPQRETRFCWRGNFYLWQPPPYSNRVHLRIAVGSRLECGWPAPWRNARHRTRKRHTQTQRWMPHSGAQRGGDGLGRELRCPDPTRGSGKIKTSFFLFFFGCLVKERASSSFIRLHLLTTPRLLTYLTGFFQSFKSKWKHSHLPESLNLPGWVFFLVCCFYFYFLFNYFSSENCFFKGLVMCL